MERIINIKIFRSGKIDMDTTHWGVQNEKNITKLLFNFPEELEEYNKEILFDFGMNQVVTDLILNNQYTVDNNVSCHSNLDVAVRVTKQDGTKLFESLPESVEFDASLEPTDDMPTAEEVSEWNTMITELNEKIVEVEDIKEDADYAKEQGDYAKQEAEKVDNVVGYVVETSEQAKEIAETAESIAKGANQSLSFGDYATMISVFSNLTIDTYKVGQNVLIVTLNVPDLWVSAIEEISMPYLYMSDDNLVAELNATGKIQVGHYILSPLETQKVELTNYIKNTDYATNTKHGVIKTGSTHGLGVTVNGDLYIAQANNSEIDAKTNTKKPIVPATLNYAVGSVKASESQSGTAKMWTSENEDGEIGLNISTEV